MNFKKFSTSDNQWHDIPYYQHKTATDTITTLPAVIYPNASTVTVGLKGNTIQNGAPNPDTPIMPQGTGERTGNLFDKDNAVIGERVLQNKVSADANAAHSDYIDVTGISTLTVNKKYDATNFYFYADKTNTSIGYVNDFTANVPAGAKYCRINVLKDDVDTIMLNSGSTALPYENFGYKIPILLNSQTINKYLGTEQTERQIDKLVLTGQESIENAGSGIKRFTVSGYLRANGNVPICTHYIGQDTVGGFSQVGELRIAFLVSSSGNNFMYIRDSSYSLDTFKAYLQQQYSAGTPVTVWYVLATPTTGITNEPLMKIGNYADSLTTTIPCTAGENSFDVQTTVQPSEVTATFEGWHTGTVHERENGSWT